MDSEAGPTCREKINIVTIVCSTISAKCEIILYLQICTPDAPKKGVLHSRKEWIACRIACIVACRTVFVLLGKHDEQNFLSYSEVTPDKCFLSL